MLAKTQCGSPLFMAPEILKGSAYDSKVDVWSLGTMFYEMLTGFAPFTGNNKRELEQAIERGDYWMPKDVKLSLEGLSFLN
jgi:serine/threonine-protein kinase ULK2